jgi:hypothetical protein
MKRNDLNIVIVVCLIAIATVLRIANASLHLYNYVPMAALGLFSCAIIKDKRALGFLVPLAGMFIADLYFHFFTTTPGFYQGQIYNYAALAASAALGLLMKQPKPATALAYVFGASATFFIISNLGVFVSGYYGYSFSGFTETYTMAIPFSRPTFTADIVGGILLFGGYFLTQRVAEKNMQKAKA